MKRLILSVLLGAFCLAMVATLSHAGQYDPRNPPPVPVIFNESSWGDPTQAHKLQCPDENTGTNDRMLPMRDNLCPRSIGFWQKFADRLRSVLKQRHYNQGATGHE